MDISELVQGAQASTFPNQSNHTVASRTHLPVQQQHTSLVEPGSVVEKIFARFDKNRNATITDLIKSIPFPQRMILRLCDALYEVHTMATEIVWSKISAKASIELQTCTEIWAYLRRPYKSDAEIFESIVRQMGLIHSSTFLPRATTTPNDVNSASFTSPKLSSSSSTSPILPQSSETLAQHPPVDAQGTRAKRSRNGDSQSQRRSNSSTKNVIQLMLLSSIRESMQSGDEKRVFDSELNLIQSLVEQSEHTPEWFTIDFATLYYAVRDSNGDWEQVRSKVGWMTVEELRVKWELLVCHAKDCATTHQQDPESESIPFTRQDAALGIHQVLESVPKPASFAPLALNDLFRMGNGSSLSEFTPSSSLSSTFGS